MTNDTTVACDGCGQTASREHITRRLQRLEWTTRYRPVHIQTLLLGAVSPLAERDFLYSPRGEFHGEAALVLEAAGIAFDGKTADAVHGEFQRAGFFLTHVLECPLEVEAERCAEDSALLAPLFAQRLPAFAARIRRSLKPKRVVLISLALGPIMTKITESQLDCPILWDGGKSFALDGSDAGNVAARLRTALTTRATD